MARINLLPWREARRKQRQQEFMGMLGAAVLVAALGVIGTHMFFAGQIDYQEARNQYLQDEINRLKRIEEEIKVMDETKARLLGRLEIIQNLQRSRPVMVHIFDELVRRLPEDIFLASFQTDGDKLTLKGTALSNGIVSLFMRELEQSDWFGEPTLSVIENKIINSVRASEFQLAVSRQKSKEEAEADEAGGS